MGKSIHFYVWRFGRALLSTVSERAYARSAHLFAQAITVFVTFISVLYQILSELQKNEYSSGRQNASIERAVAQIHANFLNSDLYVRDLAALCHMKEVYFGRIFKKRFGVPPKQYIIRLKLNYACDLLRTERYTVTQVAELCNFSDVYFFSRLFKSHVGITPTQFVRKYRSSK